MPFSPWPDPTREQVADRIPLRTARRASSKPQGTFDDATTPTGARVDAEIATAGTLVRGLVGVELPDELHAAAVFATACRTAMLIELGLFQEQIEGGQSPYVQLKELYEEALAGILRQKGEPPTTERRYRGTSAVVTSSTRALSDELAAEGA